KSRLPSPVRRDYTSPVTLARFRTRSDETMPRRPFPVFVLSVGFLLLVCIVLRPAFAQPSTAPKVPESDPVQFPQVEVELADGTTQKGKLKLSAITLKTDIGSTTVGLSHVKRITLQRDPEATSGDSLTLTDKSTVHGRVTDEVFVLEITGGEA